MNTKNLSKLNWRLIVSIVVAVAALIFVVMQWDSIRRSLEALKEADARYIILALVSFSFTVVAAAAIVFNLRLKQNEKYSPILIVQTAGLFLGRITPASLGGIAAMMRLLVTQGHTVVQATSIMGAAAIATFFGNVIISSVALILAANQVDLAELSVPRFVLFMLILFIALAIGLMFISKIRNKVQKFIKEIINNLKLYRNKKMSVLRAIVLGAFLTLMYGVTMLLVAYSLGVELTLFAAIITISLGSLGVAVTPLPGGAVGAEAAIAAALVQFGVSAEIALAIAFVYRAITFWIPLLPGFIASQYSLKKEYL